jgi:hypothetical protein
LLNGNITKERYAMNKKVIMRISFSEINCFASNRKAIIIPITENDRNPKNERFTDEGKIIQRIIEMRLIRYQAIMNLEFPRKDRRKWKSEWEIILESRM